MFRSFTLVSSPVSEAVEMVDKLRSTDPATLKPAVFALRTHIREPLFLREFVKRGGVEALQGVIKRASGNALAYALVCLQNLLELDEKGSEAIRRPFVARVVEIVSESRASLFFRPWTVEQAADKRRAASEPLINVSRPATAILRRLALQPSTAPNSAPGETGFSAVFDSVFDQPDFLAILVGKLSSGDVEVTNLSLGLLESLLRGSNELRDLRITDALDELDAWKTVGVRLLTRRPRERSDTLAWVETARPDERRRPLDSPLPPTPASPLPPRRTHDPHRRAPLPPL